MPSARALALRSRAAGRANRAGAGGRAFAADPGVLLGGRGALVDALELAQQDAGHHEEAADFLDGPVDDVLGRVADHVGARMGGRAVARRHIDQGAEAA
jgi:hypothetical protein